MLQWQPPSGGTGEWIQWDAGVNNGMGVGLTNGGTFYVASHWTPADLAPYYGMSLSKISFFPLGDPMAIYQLYVWKGPNAVNQIMTQPTGSFIVDQWKEVPLNSPVPINIGDELWFGYSVTHSPGLWPAGCDDGPAISGKGDMISVDGVDWIAMGITYDLDYNWNLAGFIESTDKTISEISMIKTLTDPAYPSFNSSMNCSKQPGTPDKFNPSSGKALLGYNVYKNSQFLAFTISTYYLDEDLVPGSYTYYVTALYDEGESVQSNELYIVCPPNLTPPTNLAVSVDINDINFTWDMPNATGWLGYNFYHSYENGPYNLDAFTTVNSFSIVDASIGLHKFYVTAVYNEGESIGSNIVEVLITSIDEIILNRVSVYPNPAKEFIYIYAERMIIHIDLYNLFGQLIRHEPANAQDYRIVTTGINPGIYLLKIEFDDIIVSHRIMIE